MTLRLLAASLVVATLLLPALPATPAACASPCTILAASPGYVAPVVEVASGALVAWLTLDISHVQVDTTLGDEHCLYQRAAVRGEPETVRLDLVDGQLFATSLGQTRLCEGAVPASDGAVVLPYHCQLHVTMRGALVVTPA